MSWASPGARPAQRQAKKTSIFAQIGGQFIRTARRGLCSATGNLALGNWQLRQGLRLLGSVSNASSAHAPARSLVQALNRNNSAQFWTANTGWRISRQIAICTARHLDRLCSTFATGSQHRPRHTGPATRRVMRVHVMASASWLIWVTDGGRPKWPPKSLPFRTAMRTSLNLTVCACYRRECSGNTAIPPQIQTHRNPSINPAARRRARRPCRPTSPAWRRL